MVLPFALKVTERTEGLPEYVTPPHHNMYNDDEDFRVGWGIDSPTGSVVIDGEVLVMFNFRDQYRTSVRIARYSGRDFEHAVRQADGVINAEPGVSTHFCGGMWYDRVGRTLYAPIHCEYDRGIMPPAGWSRKKTRLATSRDKGLTWRLEGDILTGFLPEEGDWLKYSGSLFEAGPADFDFYADERGGFFYIFTCNAFTPKSGKNNSFLWFNDAARCAISDRMAPGKWWKYAGGSWNEPGLGGKPSRVAMGSYGIYGRVIYSTFLKKYLRIGSLLGVADRRFSNLGLTDASLCVSACDDLATQDWTPAAILLDKPDNDKNGITLTDGDGVDPFACGKTLRVYNYWLYNMPSRALDVTLLPGSLPAMGLPRYGSYAYQPHPESVDPVMSRATKITGCASADVAFGGPGWTVGEDARYYRSTARENAVPGSTITFSFTGTDVYWRAAAGPDCGKADISIDGRRVETVDCFCDQVIPCQFAFIARGLDPRAPHVIRITVRGGRNPLSTGAFIRHVAFEHSAESYRASAGFSAVMGKNCWRYQAGDDAKLSDMAFVGLVKAGDARELANHWTDGEGCVVGGDHQAAGSRAAARAWVSPHDGTVRVEGTVLHDHGAVEAAVCVDGRVAWTCRVGKPGTAASHDLTLSVKAGDVIRFVARGVDAGAAARVGWDPVITYA